jgi:hypothetical protein
MKNNTSSLTAVLQGDVLPLDEGKRYPFEITKQSPIGVTVDGCYIEYGNVEAFLRTWTHIINPEETTGDISDGYHTFKELYEFRKLYNALLFNEWYKQGLYDVHKSRLHYDGEPCFDGKYFIVVATLPTGQISNHYPLQDWKLFQVRETPKAEAKYDGHTANDVVDRMRKLAKQPLPDNIGTLLESLSGPEYKRLRLTIMVRNELERLRVTYNVSDEQLKKDFKISDDAFNGFVSGNYDYSLSDIGMVEHLIHINTVGEIKKRELVVVSPVEKKSTE